MAREILIRGSEEQTLAARGYRLLKKLGEGVLKRFNVKLLSLITGLV